MSLSVLPNETLEMIFESINHLDDLLSCFKVCDRWSNLVADRLRKAKYLSLTNHHNELIKESKYFIHLNNDCRFDIFKCFDLASLKTLLCNLKVAVLSIDTTPTEIYELISTSQYCNKLEMLATDRIENYLKRRPQLKQLYSWNVPLHDPYQLTRCFSNLERIHVLSFGSPRMEIDMYSSRVVLNKLKVAELGWFDFTFVFMELCPALQSAYITTSPEKFDFNIASRNLNLQDLVLEMESYLERSHKTLRRLCFKYPNIKHLAVRNCIWIDSGHVQILIGMLSKLVLLDLRESPGINQNTADLIDNYNQRHGQSIRLYYGSDENQVKKDWPDLSSHKEKMCQGFDFMKHCFFRKSFNDLPIFLLDPID